MLKLHRVYSFNRFKGLAGMFILHIQIGHKKTLIVYFHLLFTSMFKSRSTASLSQFGISVHTQANSFHNMSLLLFSLSSSQPPAKKQRREKRKAIRYTYEKEKANRKGQDSWKCSASGEQICGSLTMRQRAASAIIVRPWMHNLQVGGN